MEVRVTKKGGLTDRLKEMRYEVSKNVSVSAGFLNGHTYTDGTLIADVARDNAYGTDKIPARPFMRRALEKNYLKWKQIMLDYYAYESIETVFALIGMEAVEDIQEQIRKWSDPANSEATIRQKGFNAPLRDTTEMLHDVEYRVNV